ncbi:MAG: class I SAM-dependent methyltransferase [Sinobacteraceae bacterium]|nr:class I SAM-dependent methyltransferase [Nevskiaceae bacterium]
MQLVSAPGGLALLSERHAGYGAVRPDWANGEMRRRIAAGRRQPLARALGLHKPPQAGNRLRLVDATGGLGRDAWVLAALGAEVRLIERSAHVAAMLEDALGRALENLAMRDTASRLRLYHADARVWLAEHSDSTWDGIYLDPMYPQTRKSALPTKAMQFLREVTHGDPDADELLGIAQQHARRVAVKRPLHATALAGCKADTTITASRVRFDLYFNPECMPCEG